LLQPQIALRIDPGSVAIRAIGVNGLRAHAAGLAEDRGAVVGSLLAQDDANAPARQQPRQALLAVAQRQRSKVFAVDLQEVESVQHGLRNRLMAV
jgi:hypothetical protein